MQRFIDSNRWIILLGFAALAVAVLSFVAFAPSENVDKVIELFKWITGTLITALLADTKSRFGGDRAETPVED